MKTLISILKPSFLYLVQIPYFSKNPFNSGRSSIYVLTSSTNSNCKKSLASEWYIKFTLVQHQNLIKTNPLLLKPKFILFVTWSIGGTWLILLKLYATLLLEYFQIFFMSCLHGITISIQKQNYNLFEIKSLNYVRDIWSSIIKLWICNKQTDRRTDKIWDRQTTLW